MDPVSLYPEEQLTVEDFWEAGSGSYPRFPLGKVHQLSEPKWEGRVGGCK